MLGQQAHVIMIIAILPFRALLLFKKLKQIFLKDARGTAGEAERLQPLKWKQRLIRGSIDTLSATPSTYLHLYY